MPSPCTIDTARTTIPCHCTRKGYAASVRLLRRRRLRNSAACGRGNLQGNVTFCMAFGPIRSMVRIGRWCFQNACACCRLPRRFAPRNDIVGVCVAIRRLRKGHALSLQNKYELFDKSEFSGIYSLGVSRQNASAVSFTPRLNPS